MFNKRARNRARAAQNQLARAEARATRIETGATTRADEAVLRAAAKRAAKRQPPPGWYPDNVNPDTQRWWDGTQWTGRTIVRGVPREEST